MSDTGHTQGTLFFDGPSSGTRINDDGGDFAIYIERDGKRHIIAEAFRRTDADNCEPAEANAARFVHAWNCHDELLKACEDQHEAIDILFAMLIAAGTGFMPTKSGKPWEAALKGNAAIAKAKGEAP